MKLIKPSFDILHQSSGLDGVYKQIEIAGRTCYKSEDKITEDSAKEFVNKLIKSGHGAMLEHGTVYLKTTDFDTYIRYDLNKYSIVNKFKHETYTQQVGISHVYFITTNYRVLVQECWLDDLKYICESTEDHAKRLSVRFIMDRIGSQSFCRHRVFSFAQESTRYCNYSKDKFSNELTFIIPCWLQTEGDTNTDIKDGWYDSLQKSEITYINLLEHNWQPQQARSVLPNSLKTELVMTGFINDWKSFFKLRTATAAHPQARELAIPLQEWFQQNNLL